MGHWAGGGGVVQDLYLFLYLIFDASWEQIFFHLCRYQLLTMSEFQDAHLAEVKPLVEKEEVILNL